MINLLVLTVVTLTSPTVPQVESIAGVEIPASVTVNGQSLVCNGVGVRTKTFLQIRVYIAALYLEQKTMHAKSVITSRSARRLDLHFLRSVSSQDLRDSIRVQFQKLPNRASLQNRVDKLCSDLPFTRKGTRLELTAVGDNLTLTVNGKDRCTIEGQDFCDAIFAIYVGDTPVTGGLKAALLGGRRE
jgi:Chalcone isomerase-like